MESVRIRQKTVKKIVDFLKEKNQFLLTAHLNADGDAIAAVIAMGLFLDKWHKKYYMILNDTNLDTRFDYLKNFDKIISYDRTLHLPIEAAVVLDVPGKQRLGKVARLLPAKSQTVKIDHHPVEDDFAILNLVYESASSATQLVYDVIEEAGVKLDLPMAEAIYTGIVYDTGRFSFSNTTSRDLMICSKLIDIGVDPAKLTSRIFFESSFESIRTIGKGLASMENYLDGLVNVIYLDHSTMRQNHQAEIEELANYSVGIRGGVVGVFIRELRPRFHKISLRAKEDVDVNRIARAFDGGGHKRAAGCRIEGSKSQVIKKLLVEIKKQL